MCDIHEPYIIYFFRLELDGKLLKILTFSPKIPIVAVKIPIG